MSLLFFLNGTSYSLSSFDPTQNFASWLEKSNFRGTKVACSEGGCGACTVLQSFYDSDLNKVVHRPVLACLLPLAAIHGTCITSVEGLGSTKTCLHPIQQRMVDLHATQCGFCTPGIVMHIYAFLLNNPDPSVKDIEDSFSAAPNLCRCTGYRPILDAAKTFAKDSPNKIPCHNDAFNFSFPPELQSFDRSFSYFNDTCKWFAPPLLSSLLQLKNNIPMLIQRNLLDIQPEICLFTANVAELSTTSHTSSHVRFGAGITIASLADSCRQLASTLPSSKTSCLLSLANQTDHFASGHVKGIATLAGNVVTASPVSDLLPVLLSCQAVFIASKITDEGKVVERRIEGNDWIVGYRKVALGEDEILVGVEVPLCRKGEYVKNFKISKRKEDDIAIVNGGIRMLLTPQDQSYLIEECSLVFGGMSPITKICTKTSKFLTLKPLTNEVLYEGLKVLAYELKLSLDAPGGMIKFRMTMCGTFLSQFWEEITSKLHGHVDVTNLNQSNPIEQYKSTQTYEHSSSLIGSTIPRASGPSHTTGESVYSLTRPPPYGVVHAVIVQAPAAHGRILGIDDSKAMEVEGVLAVVTAKDLKNAKKFGPIIDDEDILAAEEFVYEGQPVALVLSESYDTARSASKLVKVSYEELPSILTIEQAIEQDKFLVPQKSLIQGDITALESQSDAIVSGEVRLKDQEHFYFETQNVTIIPGEEYTVFASTQNPTEAQHVVAHTLGVPFNQVNVKVIRLGGAFGGKETALLLPALAAVAVGVVNRPVRLALTRQEDFILTGKKHPFLFKYRAGFSKEGKFLFRDMELFSNGGCSLDLSPAILERALFHSDGVYKAEASRVVGRVCFSNRPSNTAFRGFGGPKGLLVAEEIMAKAALALGMDEEELKEKNLYTEGDLTHFDMKLVDCNIKKAWDQIKESSEFSRRKTAIDLFNVADPVIKRGISMQAIKFGISFTKTFMNKAAALVTAYTDGSVLVSSGGIEMGNGLNLKLQMIAADCLGIDIKNIRIGETSTDKCPNTSPTAASTGTDLNGKAVEDACLKILENLKPLKEQFPEASFAELCNKAFFERIPTTSTGYYATPINGWDWDKGTGDPFYYFTYGAACVESEINTRTGEMRVMRADILMDGGSSINPAVDIGQIEGAFLQGLGWLTMEEIVRSKSGKVISQGPGAYKLPTFTDIPRDFRVSLMKGVPNPKAIKSSKGIGEPPTSLVGTVYNSIRYAVNSYRNDKGLPLISSFGFPASVNRVRLACPDEVSALMTSVYGDDDNEVDIY
ncbi:hypothetical protein GEMRC1_006274 [Eukaryota sp. GEM-RC1]